MTDHTDKFSRDLQTISLTSQEREAMRARLYATMQLDRPRTGSWAFLARHAAALSALAVFATAGTALGAAQQSMPGDALYPLRLAVNDRVALYATGDEDARLDLELQQAERSIDEEEIVLNGALAELIIEAEAPAASEPAAEDSTEVIQVDAGATVEADAELDDELRALERILDDEESAIDVELTL